MKKTILLLLGIQSELLGIQFQRGVSMATKLSLSQACEGMIRYKMAAGKSEHTIVDYRSSFKKLHLFFPDDPLFHPSPAKC